MIVDIQIYNMTGTSDEASLIENKLKELLKEVGWHLIQFEQVDERE